MLLFYFILIMIVLLHLPRDVLIGWSVTSIIGSVAAKVYDIDIQIYIYQMYHVILAKLYFSQTWMYEPPDRIWWASSAFSGQ